MQQMRVDVEEDGEVGLYWRKLYKGLSDYIRIEGERYPAVVAADLSQASSRIVPSSRHN
jgi:hypothetical protein